MKKILFSMMALIAMAGASNAQTNALTVADITLPQNSEAELTVSFQLDAADTYTGYSFQLELPAELAFVMSEGTDVACTKGSCHDASHSVTANLSERLVKVAGLSLASKPLVGTSGSLLTFTIKPATTTLTVGQTFTGHIKNILIVPVEGTKQSLSDATFTVTIGAPADTRTVLDETSTEMPSAATGVDVRVKRTITAGVWSTICLPFAMTETQVKAAFGSDVELADFKGAETVFDKSDNVVGIRVSFDEATAIAANHPYLIKVSTAVEEFTADGVDIVPQEDEAYVEYDNGRTGSRRVVYSGFYGTYRAATVLDEGSLYLNGGQYYYSSGDVEMKAFRAYFVFLDELADKAAASTQVIIDVAGQATGIDAIDEHASNSQIYDLQGRKIADGQLSDRLRKGLYVRNHKKVVLGR